MQSFVVWNIFRRGIMHLKCKCKHQFIYRIVAKSTSNVNRLLDFLEEFVILDIIGTPRCGAEFQVWPKQ